MGHHPGKEGTRCRRQSPPPTAHRLAAWLSLARGFANAPAKEVRFPPSEDDVHALCGLWRQRVAELRDAGVTILQNPRVYGRAVACKPHAFAYTGEGEVCRLLFCPFCNAADAAAAYERVRRVVHRRGKEVGLTVQQVTRRLDLGDLRAGPPALISPRAGALGSLVKYSFWPPEWAGGRAVLASRVLAAVPPEEAKLLWEARRKARETFRERGGGFTHCEAGFDDTLVAALHSGYYAVRPCPLSIARAVGHLFQYPAALLTAPAEAVAAVLNATAGRRTSAVRGVFRTALPLEPRLYPRQFVPTRPGGVGVATAVASLLPHADEGLAARELARSLSVAPADTFAALSRRVGLPLYWLGRLELSVADLVRPTKKSGLWQAVADRRPRRPGDRHGLVCLSPGLGLVVLSTWPPAAPHGLFATPLVGGIGVRGKRYTLETGDSFGRRFLRRQAG
jgi:hypothetical protein